jgi:polysaccharide export outer membrane protein
MGGQTGQFGTGMDIPQANPNLEIEAGDLIDVVVFDAPDLSGRFRVNAKGDILLPLTGALHVAGLTLEQITDAVTKRYKDEQILLSPQVTVFVSELVHRTVTISGEVRSQGIYPVPGPRTLSQVLAMAGGLNDSASRTVSIVHAADPDHIVHVTLNLGAPTLESLRDSRIQIKPGDQIYVARSGLVYVVGDMLRPGGYQVEHNNRLTLLEAVALAGGPANTAKLSNARLIRRSPTGREELTINLQKVLHGGGPDILLTDGDILYVPFSLRKQIQTQSLQAAISAATSYGIFKISQF